MSPLVLRLGLNEGASKIKQCHRATGSILSLRPFTEEAIKALNATPMVKTDFV
jgi:hypothetical protein